MKHSLRKWGALAALLIGSVLQAQVTISTSPPLTGNNGSSAVVFEVHTQQPVFITQFANTHNVGAVTAEIWYRVGGALVAGQTTPNVTVANGWILAGTATGVTAANNTSPVALPIPGLSIPVLPGQPIGVCVNGTPAGGSRYMTHVATNQEDFTSAGVTVKTGPGFGFGGSFPAVTIASRQFVGAVTFIPAGPCTSPPFVGAAVATKSLVCANTESFGLSLDTATFGSGQSYQWQSSTDSITWANMANDTNFSFTTTQAVTRFYRLVVTCGTTSATSLPVRVVSPAGNLAGGTYTVNNALPTAGTNFNSLVAFADAIKCNGIGGPIVLNVAANSGPYNGEVFFGVVPGMSATNTITINGNGAKLTKTTGGTTRGALVFNGSQHFTVNNLVIENVQPANAYGIEMLNMAQFITIDGCTVEVAANVTVATVAGIIQSNSPTSPTAAGMAASDVTIKNTTIIGGYYSVIMNGPTVAPWSANNVFENNNLRDFYFYGLWVRGNINSVYKDNDISRATRSTLSTFFGIYTTGGMENVQFLSNAIHNVGDAVPTSTFACYPIYVIATNGTAAAPALFANNVVYNLNGNGINYGIYLLSGNFLNFYHNTVSISNQNANNVSAQRALWVSATSGNFTFINNIFHIDHSGTGVKNVVFLTSTVPTFTLNHNQYFINSGAVNHIGFYSAANQTTWANWRAVNNGAFEVDGIEGNPVFSGPATNNMAPLSGIGNNIAQNLNAIVPTDFLGASRSATPDIGAIEYAPITEDIAITAGNLFKGQCLSTTDTVQLTISNVIGATKNFATESLTISWAITGPVNSAGTITVNTGTLALGASRNLQAFTANLSVPGNYTLNASLSPSTTNLSPLNDTLLPLQYTVREVFEASPRAVTITNNTDSVEITVRSPFLPSGSFYFTEICHFKTLTGAPTAGWPGYLLADDYVEITGVPGSDLGGLTMELWNASTTIYTHTFNPGTLIGPNGTCIVATGQLNGSFAVPASFFYTVPTTIISSSTTLQGYILRNAGVIVDAVAHGAYTFPAAANVTAADWTGTTTVLSSSGIRLEGAYTKNATNWINSNTSPQDPNSVNNNVVVPSPLGVVGFTWSLNGAVVDTNVNTYVGPWSVPGVYNYIAAFNTPCGMAYDTVRITVSFPVPCDAPTNATTANVGCSAVDVSWNSAATKVASRIEYGPAGFTAGNGTIVNNANSPATISGLMAGTAYDFIITDSCTAGGSPAVTVSATTNPAPVAAGIATINTVTALDATVDFDATASTDYTSISWVFGDGNTGTGATVSHTYTQNQTYTVTVIATGACGVDSTTIQVTVAGINVTNHMLASSMRVFPNPTAGELRITYNNPRVQNVTVRIAAISGQLMYENTQLQVEGDVAQRLDLGNYAAGMYLLQISTPDGMVNHRISVSK